MLSKPWYTSKTWSKSKIAKESKKRAKKQTDKRNYTHLSLATENSDGVFKILTLLFLSGATVVTITLTGESQDLRSSAAGRPAGRVFCQGKPLCDDQHCEGDSWIDCADCPVGRAKIITQTQCGVYQETGCVYDQFTSCEDL